MILHGQRMAGIIAQLTAAARKRKGKKEITSAKCIHSLEVMPSTKNFFLKPYLVFCKPIKGRYPTYFKRRKSQAPSAFIHLR